MLKQGTYMTPRNDLQCYNPETKRNFTYRAGEKLWVTTTQTYTAEHGLVRIGRAGKTKVSCGPAFSVADAESLFRVLV